MSPNFMTTDAKFEQTGPGMVDAYKSAVSGSGSGGNFFTRFLDSGGLSDLATTGLNIAAYNDLLNRLGDVGSGLATGAREIGEEAQAATQFRPFTVTTGFGGVQATPEGGFTTALSPQQQARQEALSGITGGLLGDFTSVGAPQALGIQEQAMTGAQAALGGIAADPNLTAQRQALQGMFAGRTAQPTSYGDIAGLGAAALGQTGGLLSQVTGDRGAREQAVYEQLRAIQAPEEERQRIALQEQLQAQGRTGLRTAQFGGSPEQFALAKAQEEAKNRASLMAMQQAAAEQQQDLGTLQALSNLGITGATTAQALGAQDLSDLLRLQQADIGSASAQQALQQGQLGLSSGMFGLGAQAAQLPYQLQGLGQGLTAQQLANIQTGMGLEAMPEQQLLSTLAPAINIASLADVGRRGGAGLAAEAGISGLEALAQTELGRASALRDLYTSVLGAGGSSQAGDATSLFEKFLGALRGDE